MSEIELFTSSGSRDRRLIQAEEQQGTKIPIDTLLAGPRFDALLVGWIVFPQGLHVLVQEKKTFSHAFVSLASFLYLSRSPSTSV